MGGILMTIGLVASMGYAALIGPPVEAQPGPSDEAEIGGTPTAGGTADDLQPVVPTSDGGWQGRATR